MCVESYSRFFNKNISIYAIFNDQSFSDMLTNDIVGFEQILLLSMWNLMLGIWCGSDCIIYLLCANLIAQSLSLSSFYHLKKLNYTIERDIKMQFHLFHHVLVSFISQTEIVLSKSLLTHHESMRI